MTYTISFAWFLVLVTCLGVGIAVITYLLLRRLQMLINFIIFLNTLQRRVWLDRNNAKAIDRLREDINDLYTKIKGKKK